MRILFAFCSLLSANASNITFENVTVIWHLGVFVGRQRTYISSSDSLKENQPNVSSSSQLSVSVRGVVPVLYENAISDIENLQSLTLWDVELQEIKRGALQNLPQLQYLILSNNRLEKIADGSFVGLNLSQLVLENNLISELEQNAFENVSVVSLNLGSNQLRTIKAGVFGNITKLETLVLRNNILSNIDPEVFNLPDLLDLDLSFNQIAELRPGDLQNLASLKTLNLKKNLLRSIGEGVFNGMDWLVGLKLNHNTLTTIATKAFDGLPSLSEILINNNNLTNWDKDWLRHSSKLSFLLASFNRFQEIPDEAFKNYPIIFEINLRYNQIKHVAKRALAGVESIGYLYLDHNLIEEWDENLLSNVTVWTFILNSNKLKCIAGDLEVAFAKCSRVWLEGNPLDVECRKKLDKFVGKKKMFPYFHV